MRVVTETALSHGCGSPWHLSFPGEEEEAASVLHRAAGMGCGLNTGIRETAATGKLCRTLQGNMAALRLLSRSWHLLETKPGIHVPER